MNNTIDLSKPVAQTIKEHPEVKDILVELGFKPLANPAMLNTVGKVTTLLAGLHKRPYPTTFYFCFGI